MKSPLKSFIVFLSILPLAGCSGTPEPAKKENGAVRQVTLSTLRLEKVPDYYEASGNVRARNSTTLSAKMPGFVRSVLVREGQRVRAGQLLVEIDSPELGSQSARANAGATEARNAQTEIEQALLAADAGIKAAEAQSRLAQETFNRFKTLLAKDSVSRQEYDEAETRWLSAQAQLDQARRTRDSLQARKQQVEARIQQAQAEQSTAQTYLSYLKIVAPYEGVVAKRFVDPGTLAAPGLPLLTVEDYSELQLEVSVPESYRWKIDPRKPVLTSLENADISDFLSTPLEVVTAADPATRSFAFKLSLPKSERLRSGMFGRARFPVGTRESLQVQASSLVRQGQLDGVFVGGADGRAEWRLVKIGRQTVDQLEVLSGLKEGDRIVVNPPTGLSAGDRLEVRS
jgi:multidrug efflux pump subunit AcrA (membrane-fusion protein)